MAVEEGIVWNSESRLTLFYSHNNEGSEDLIAIILLDPLIFLIEFIFPGQEELPSSPVKCQHKQPFSIAAHVECIYQVLVLLDGEVEQGIFSFSHEFDL